MDVPGWSGRDLEIISGLRKLGDAGEPDAATRKRIHGDLVERLAREQHHKPSRRRRIVAEVLAAAVALAIALGGIGMLLSKNAVPGDALYAVKRAGESAELGLAFGDSAKAQKHLEFAGKRLTELSALGHAGAGAYQSTLADFQHEAKAGTAELTRFATQGSGRRLDQLRSWSLDQRTKLLTARPAVPAAALNQFTSSAELLSRIEARAQTLMARLDCFEITTGQTDDLGAVPQSGSCEPPSDAITGSRPLLPLPAVPGSQAAPPQQMSTSVPSAPPSTATPTPPVPPASGGPVPPVFPPPVIAPSNPRPPATTTSQPPSISIPPLLPGLPGVGIG